MYARIIFFSLMKSKYNLKKSLFLLLIFLQSHYYNKLIRNYFGFSYCIPRFKMQQIPEIAATSFNGSTIRVYRMGDHIDISRGPMMSSTALLGRFSVTAVSTFHILLCINIKNAINIFSVQTYIFAFCPTFQNSFQFSFKTDKLL